MITFSTDTRNRKRTTKKIIEKKVYLFYAKEERERAKTKCNTKLTETKNKLHNCSTMDRRQSTRTVL